MASSSLVARLGQQFVIDNRPGGGGNIGTEAGTLPDKLILNGHGRSSISKEHSMRTMTRTIALAFVLLGLASAPLAAQANPPPPSNPPGAQPTGPQYQGPPLHTPQAQSPQPQGPQYSSNEIVDAGHRFFGTISRELGQIVEK